jgi:hypothetical protein
MGKMLPTGQPRLTSRLPTAGPAGQRIRDRIAHRDGFALATFFVPNPHWPQIGAILGVIFVGIALNRIRRDQETGRGIAIGSMVRRQHGIEPGYGALTSADRRRSSVKVTS